MIRNVCAVLAGLIVGMVFNLVVVGVDFILYPMPEGVDFQDTEGVAAYIKSLPLLALLIVLVAHLGQAFFGGWVAAILSRNNPMMVAMIVGGLSLIAGLINMLELSLPAWMWIEMPLYLVVAWIAAKLELKRRGSRANQTSPASPAA